MATALFISRTDLVKNSILDGNVDTDKFIQFIKISQEIHIQNYLGSKLYDKISADIIAGTLTGDYQIKNGGVFKHSSENSETVSKTEIDFLTQKQRDFAEYYTRRFVDYICENSNKFPEYNNNTGADVYPTKKANSSNWVL